MEMRSSSPQKLELANDNRKQTSSGSTLSFSYNIFPVKQSSKQMFLHAVFNIDNLVYCFTSAVVTAEKKVLLHVLSANDNDNENKCACVLCRRKVE